MAAVASMVGHGIFTSLINAGSRSIISSARSILALVCTSSSSSSLDMVSTKSIELSLRSTSIGWSDFGLSLIRLTSRVFCSTDSLQAFCDSPTSTQTAERDWAAANTLDLGQELHTPLVLVNLIPGS